MAARTRSPFVPVLGAGQATWQTPAPRFGFPFRLLLVLALLPLLLGASLIVVYRQQQGDRIYPGVAVYGVNLGRMTHDEAVQAIKARLGEYARRPFLLRYDDDAVSLSLGNLGLRVDDAEVSAIADRALSVGHEEAFRPWLQSQMDLMREGVTLAAHLDVDRERAAAVLARVAVDVERPTLNATIEVQKVGERFEIHTSPAATGRRLNIDATVDRLQQALQASLPQSVDLVLDEAPPAVTDADVAPAIATIDKILAAPLELKDGARNWRLDPNAAFGMLHINGLDTATPPITVSLDDAKLRDFVEKSARAADLPAKNPGFGLDGDKVVVVAGTLGKLADADATFEQLKPVVGTDTRSVDMVFKEDRPWLTEADLEPYRIQANALLDLPIIVEAPAGIMPTPIATPQTAAQAGATATARALGTPGATPSPAGTPRPGATPGGDASAPATPPPLPTARPSEGMWVIDRKQLAQLIALPNTQVAPRDYATLPLAQRPRFDVSLDSAKVSTYIQREIGPWVSLDPVDAELRLASTQVAVPNTSVRPDEDPGQSGRQETRFRVDLRNAADGRGPDLNGTFAAMQALFRSALPPGSVGPVVPAAPAQPVGAASALQGSTPVPAPSPNVTVPVPTAIPAAAAATAVPLPAVPADWNGRRVTLRMAVRTPRVQDRDLAGARDVASQMIGQPVQLRWNGSTWTITSAELASMLRYQTVNNAVAPYLTRDGLLDKAAAIAREAERRPDAPLDSKGAPLPLDVPRTAAVIWELASGGSSNRTGDVVWAEEDVPPADSSTPPGVSGGASGPAGQAAR